MTAHPLISTFHFFFSCSAAPRDLHSFPTRRSSDLCSPARGRYRRNISLPACVPARASRRRRREARAGTHRSEEHTSELQSQFHLVCRLLLEKKKKIKNRCPSLQFKSHTQFRLASIL